MTRIYFNPRSDRKKELAFFDFLLQQLEDVEHIKESYPLPINLLTNHIDVHKLIENLTYDNQLPTKKRLATIEALRTLPKNIFVAKAIKNVSVDFTIEIKQKLHFI